MAEIEFRLPKLAMSMVEGEVLEWHVKEGDQIAEGADIVTISTDKVDNALPSPGSGTVTKILVAPGTIVEVGTLLAVIAG